MNTNPDSKPPGQFYCPTCEKTFFEGERCPTDGTKLVKLKAVVDPLLGRELDGRYTIIEKLGQGGMGAVYRSSQHSVGRDCAIKVVGSHLMSDPEVIKRFLREAKLASRLSHPNAVGVVDFGQTDDGLFYLVMELVSGRTLDQVLKKEKTFKPERIVRIGTQICDALEGAHQLQIIHRDLKPANVMLLSSGRDLVKVLDFGLAKSVAPDQTSTTMTNAGALLGTPAFMPPELALGQPCDGRADLYSLGVMLYLMAEGHLPFISESAHELIAMHGMEQAPAVENVPPALAKVIDRLLRKDPNERYQTASELRDALEAALDNRYNTPMPMPVQSFDTNPSLGPFPANSGDFAALDSLTPQAPVVPAGKMVAVGRNQRRPRSATEMDRLISSDTMGVNDALRPRQRGKRALLAAGALVAIAGAATIVFLLTQSSPEQQHVAPPPPSTAPAAPPPQQVVTPPPAPVPAEVVTPPPAPPPVTVDKPVTAAKPEEPKKHHSTTKKKPPPAPLAAPPQPPTQQVKPPPPPQPPVDEPQKPAKLPF